jgi:hypothetical protein
MGGTLRLGPLTAISTPCCEAELTVPANCPVQFLDLIVASGGKGQMGLEATVASVSVAPAS